MKKWIIGILIVMLAVAMRMYRIDTNSHFRMDEARDLVNIHQIFVEKKITLVGPISDDGNHLFSSLTYYLLLPFAYIFNFDPMGTVIGAVFWGMVTFAILWILAIKINPQLWIFSGIMAALWWPLVEISRWPWNPNMVPMWMGLSIYLSLRNEKIFKLMSGLSSGLALHHHFLAIISAGFVWLKNKNEWWMVGILLAIAPFVIFDIRHPPGLFFSKMIGFSSGTVSPNLIEVLKFSSNYLFVSGVVGILALILLVLDIKDKNKNIYWGVTSILTLGVFYKYSVQFHYILATIPLVWMWLFGKRENVGNNFAKVLIVVICIFSIVRFNREINKIDYHGNIRLISGACKIIKNEIEKNKLSNANIAVLGTTDQDGIGKTYRGVLLTWNVRLKSKDEYLSSDNLFVITQGDIESLRTDGAAEISQFKNGPVAGVWPVSGTDYQVVQFNRY